MRKRLKEAIDDTILQLLNEDPAYVQTNDGRTASYDLGQAVAFRVMVRNLGDLDAKVIYLDGRGGNSGAEHSRIRMWFEGYDRQVLRGRLWSDQKILSFYQEESIVDPYRKVIEDFFKEIGEDIDTYGVEYMDSARHGLVKWKHSSHGAEVVQIPPEIQKQIDEIIPQLHLMVGVERDRLLSELDRLYKLAGVENQKRKALLAYLKTNSRKIKPKEKGGGGSLAAYNFYRGITEEKVRIYNKDLSPQLWTSPEKLNSEVRNALIQIAHAFYKDSELKAKLLDLYFLGSSANYNWTPNSDIDVHLIVDSKELGFDIETAKKYFHALSSKWNQEHEIQVKGHKVELYIQDVNETNASTAVYSLIRDLWVKRPVPEKVSVDKNLIQKKFSMWVDRINNALKTKDEVKLKQILDTLKKYRQSGLDNGGELSTENLVFKILRSRGEIDKIKNTYNTEFNKRLSVPEAFDPTSQGPNTDVQVGDDAIGAFYKSQNNKMRRMEEVSTKDLKQVHPKFASDDNTPLSKFTLDNLNALRAKVHRAYKWYKKHPENADPDRLKDLIVYDKKLKDEIDQRLGLINEPITESNQPIQSKHLRAEFGHKDISKEAAKVFLGDEWFANVYKNPVDFGRFGGKWVINSHEGMFKRKLQSPEQGFNSIEEALKWLDDLIEKQPMVRESYGTGIPEKDRLKITNNDGSVRRWQIRSKDAPNTPKLEEFTNKLVNDILDKTFGKP